MFIPNPGSEFFHPGSQVKKIPDSGSRVRIKEFKYFYPKKLFLSSRKYDPGCLSWIRIPELDFLPFPGPGAKKAPDTGSATLKNYTVYILCQKRRIWMGRSWIRIRIRRHDAAGSDPQHCSSLTNYSNRRNRLQGKACLPQPMLQPPLVSISVGFCLSRPQPHGPSLSWPQLIWWIFFLETP